MAQDIFYARPAQANFKNGCVLVRTSFTRPSHFQSLSNDPINCDSSTVLADISGTWQDRFDDPRYYNGDNS